MASKTKMAAAAAAANQESAEDREARLANRTYLADDAAWDNVDEPEFGGQSDILEMEVGEIAGPLTYIGSQPMQTDLGETTVHTASTVEGSTVRCPISATFLRALDQAGIRRGDQFLVKRHEDVTKKAGKGKGQIMQVYAIKVTKRVIPQTA